jgi:hypothetical protein
MNEIGKWLVIIGGFVALLGGLIWAGSKIGLPFGHLPGDIRISGEKFSFFFPIATSIALSIILTVVINIILAILKK